jgi:hypothetical protein
MMRVGGVGWEREKKKREKMMGMYGESGRRERERQIEEKRGGIHERV